MDFDAKARLLAQPVIVARHSLSKNDVELLSGWFIVDRQIANPEQLHSILSELGSSGVTAQFESVRTAIHRSLNHSCFLCSPWPSSYWR
ncbi:hypothetical protein [Bradyrhizobium australiense]|uniref:Uncharacterized protein n=1 Tax=Bradyrhizobium australiense TaxID=2721161 RepID=A0A7Y4GX45_9BRAD|nr:hypothetical protein [Bradyrhizobium australiense]NOJ43551.1 hypothetical protein [Bradyrhizobium australiense]